MLDLVIGLGANLGNRRASLSKAVEMLEQVGRPVGLSRLYESAPVGGPPQPHFLNAAARLHCDREPTEILERLLELERSMGRQRTVPWGPRTLDLDLLWIADRSVNEPQLIVPHPRLTERAFALRPLLDVAPEAVDPRTGERYRAILERIGTEDLVVVAEPVGPPFTFGVT